MTEEIPQYSEFVIKKCKKCGNMRKFLVGTPRDKESICGNCWDWENDPQYIKLTPEEAEKLKKLLAKG